MPRELPAIRGTQLIRLLKKDGWQERGKAQANHGAALWKQFEDRKRVTIVRNTRKVIPIGTLSAILGPKQTNLGRDGLLKLIDTHGL